MRIVRNLRATASTEPPTRTPTGNSVPYFGAETISQLMPMDELVRVVGTAFSRDVVMPPRLALDSGDADWLVMPGLGPSGFLCKILRVLPEATPEHPTMAGVAVLLDAHGSVVCLLDAVALTTRRTAAVAGYATERMARPDASVLALYGVGALARAHVEALTTVRPLREVRVVASRRENAERFAASLRADAIPARAADPETAALGADLISTVTTSSLPVLPDHAIEPGTHVNAMGSYRPERREIPGPTVARARVAVELRDTAWREAGDLIQARDEHLISESHVVAELASDDLDGVRRSPEDVTLFKSVGHVAFDVAAAGVLLGRLAAQDGTNDA